MAAEAIKVVNEVTTHEGLKGLVDLSQVNALLEHLIAVHIHEELEGQIGGRRSSPGEFRSVPSGFDELVDVLCQRRNQIPCPVLKNDGYSAGQPDSFESGRPEEERQRQRPEAA